MLDKLRLVNERYEKLCEDICNSEIIADNKLWQKLVKEKSSLDEIVEVYHALKRADEVMRSAEQNAKDEKDSELKQMFMEEYLQSKQEVERLSEEAKYLLLPKDEHDDKDVIIEIRAGAGGDEAGIFGLELMKMYVRYAERNRWKVEVSDINETEAGGIKDCTLMVHGKDAFMYLKYESGVHRVQRVPVTETQGRVHTSTATVAVLPQLEDVEFEINDKDLRVDTYRSSGAGGQHVNKTDSAIRLTHFPTGIVVCCQDERSQIKNRERAMSILKSKLYDFYKSQQDKEYAENRKNQIGNGDRCEKIRTYNFPQSRITDHRIGMSVFNTVTFMDGDIQGMIDELILADRKAKLEASMQ